MISPSRSRTRPSFELEVDLTQDDIDNGIPAKECECPMAHALNRAIANTPRLTGYRAVITRHGFLLWCEGQQDYYCQPPLEVMNRIDDYDMGNGMQPFQATLIFR